MACDCIERLEKQWPNHAVDCCDYIDIGTGKRVLPRVRVLMKPVAKKRGVRVEQIFVSFCPFCGVRYEAEEEMKTP